MVNLLEQVSQQARRHSIDNRAPASDSLNVAVDQAIENHLHSISLDDELDLRKRAQDQLFGFGVLQPLLDDEGIEEIWINGPDKIFIAKNGLASRVNGAISAVQISAICERMLRRSGRRLDRSSPFVDASLPDGSRFHAVIPDVTRSDWSINIRKFPSRVLSLSDLEMRGAVTGQQVKFLSDSVRAGKNILVSGATQAGKTTVLCALLEELPDVERVVTVEETFEIRLSAPDWVAMQTRQGSLEGSGEVTLRRLIKEALRMRPSRLVVGEVREAEALDLLIALNSGLPGLCTIHANSAREAINKICTLPLLAGQNITRQFVQPTVASCIDLVVHCQMVSSGQRKVREIHEVAYVDGELVTTEVHIGDDK